MMPWSDTTVRRIGYGVIAIALALGAATVAMELSAGRVADAAESGVLAGSFGLVLALSVRAVPRNGAIWALIWVALVGTASGLGDVLALERAGLTLREISDQSVKVGVAPSEIDPLAAIGLAVSDASWPIVLFVLGIHVLILFPSGSAVSPGWRRVAWASAIAITATSIASALAMAPWVDRSYDEIYGPLGPGGVFGVFWIPLVALAGASFVHLFRRYRRSTGEERLQYRWVTWSLGMIVAFILLITVGGSLIPRDSEAFTIVLSVMFFLSLMLIPVSFAIAITKYRLYDIDLVISRTVVYGSLAVFIGAVYVAIVVGIGQLIGAGDEPNAGLAIAATAIVAVAFQPLRRRLERVANRLVYGRRATPYEVLSEFSRRVAATDESLLDDAARSLVDGTSAEHAAVWVTVGDRLVKTAEWPEGNGGASYEVTPLPISEDGVELGVLTLGTARGQRLPDEDHRLATEVASGMGLALRNQLLTESLQARVEELRNSRQRLVAVQDETRRKLERDLHDGAQQQLVALKVKLGLARAIAEKGGASETAALIKQLTTEADEAVDAMREFARGVYPPLLEAEGLGSAIAAQARRARLPVTFESDGIGRFSRDVEATVYFCVLEALQNTAKHANATRAAVSLSQTNGSLVFTVTDDGEGYEAGDTPRGAGLTNMEDRLDATGGTLSVEASPGRGVSITGTLPIATEVTT